MMTGLVAVIPARYDSSRLPGKPLQTIGDFPLIVWVYRRVKSCPDIDEVVVATDDPRIVEAVEKDGGKAVMTSPSHLSGTDRVAEVAELYPGRPILNVQGDEPAIDPGDLSRLAAWCHDGEGDIGTLMTPIRSAEEFFDPSVVKVVCDQEGKALYFSRAPIPWPREWGQVAPDSPKPVLPDGLWRHIGVYLYRPGVVGRLTSLSPSPLEKLEYLEQLRALQNGMTIACLVARRPAVGIDTPEDLARAREYFRRGLFP